MTWTFDRGGIDAMDLCPVCSAPVNHPGLCGQCREWFEVGPNEQVVSLPIVDVINPEDLRDTL